MGEPSDTACPHCGQKEPKHGWNAEYGMWGLDPNSVRRRRNIRLYCTNHKCGQLIREYDQQEMFVDEY